MQWFETLSAWPNKACQIFWNIKVILLVLFSFFLFIYFFRTASFIMIFHVIKRFIKFYLEIVALQRKRLETCKNKNWIRRNDNKLIHASLFICENLAKYEAIFIIQFTFQISFWWIVLVFNDEIRTKIYHQFQTTEEIVRRRHIEHHRRNKDKFINDIFQWVRIHVDRRKKPYIYQFCVDTGCHLEEL